MNRSPQLLFQSVVVLWRHVNIYCDVFLTDCPQNVSSWVTCVFPPSPSWLLLVNHPDIIQWTCKGHPISRLSGPIKLTLLPAWISNHIPRDVWGEITYPFPNINGDIFNRWYIFRMQMPVNVLGYIDTSCNTYYGDIIFRHKPLCANGTNRMWFTNCTFHIRINILQQGVFTHISQPSYFSTGVKRLPMLKHLHIYS